ncbi:aminoglycoside phosphotransferase [Streptomyces sp. NBC_00887]|uniref:aminoglycoside phosphotransferase n=1 Tax=Streptomyces sp. NBC_00887 TaxID=2975859 RepID=UPI00386CE79D|nr:aminoglycoside phosphotransferase [Streptomyces sp. NBC_00887]WSY36859.1 aminoglycoside phosphotransferase [Streptomyces sp. NBC_00887]
MSRIPFDQLPADVRQAVADKTGAVHQATTVSGGMNSGIASVLRTENGSIFVKGIPADHPQAAAQRREAAVAPHLPPSCPHLYWHLAVDGWSILGYEVIDGRHADYSPGSADLSLVAAALAELQGIAAPADVDIKDAADRWADYAPPGTLHHFEGKTLLHTDFAPDNVLITQGRARLVDWAWPTRGAAWIDPGALVLRLMDAGHSAEQAIAFADRFPSWCNAAPEVLAAFGAATATLWREIAEQDSDEWKQGMAEHAVELERALGADL